MLVAISQQKATASNCPSASVRRLYTKDEITPNWRSLPSRAGDGEVAGEDTNDTGSSLSISRLRFDNGVLKNLPMIKLQTE
ncbi:unnamed protein product [Toxocara canis]|uniref:Uncharacterized protein n=1 Tax=Toxocara canis TaxID=6265 RepID=A0A183U7K7_TOXCA|nr:unnamed protein product [Toxocara canis]